MKNNDGIKYEIIKNFGKISETSKGWAKEINLIAWNDREPKIDIREWSPGHERMSRGLTFTREEAQIVRDILSTIDLD